MFEIPETLTLARQMRLALAGKTVKTGSQGNSPHKFVWYNRTPEEFEQLTSAKLVGEAYARGRWIFLPLEPGYLLVIGECGGRLLYHPPGSALPGRYHMLIRFTDGSALSEFTQMWGAMELYETGQELERPYIKDMRLTPVDPEFTWSYFDGLVENLLPEGKRSVKSLLTQDQIIPGLGNAIAQDILFEARLHPKHPLQELNPSRRRRLYDAIVGVVETAASQGGRYDETDLFGNPGGYFRKMDAHALLRPCPGCGGRSKKSPIWAARAIFARTVRSNQSGGRSARPTSHLKSSAT